MAMEEKPDDRIQREHHSILADDRMRWGIAHARPG